ncbi:MAG: hypothetical protein EHM36_01915 [Deltaproteobacteria bacterium]|nr:MAG: hypothetical protein EHM36_01915 [Deltaproteobacteria bacterium]
MNLYPTPNEALPFYFYYAKYHAASGVDDGFLHVLGDEFDETIILGVAWKACEIIEEKPRASYFLHGGSSIPERPLIGSYLYDLNQKARVKLNRYKAVSYEDM